MSRVDTTSFAQILTGALGQGANMAQSAASLRQRREEAAAQQAMQQQQFAANEAQRAFSNDMQSQRLGLDQLQFQTMTDRIAQEQAAEQEDRMMGGAVGASSGVFDQYLRLSAQQNGGAPSPDDLIRVRKWNEHGISTRALTTLRDAVQKGADLREIKAKAERLGGIVDNMMADPKNEKARPALELIREMVIDPNTQKFAVQEAYGLIQQQQAAQQAAAEQAQRAGLVTAMQSAGPLSPEQQLAIQGDPSLRRIFEQVNQPAPAAPPDPAVVAQLFTRMQNGDTAARAQLIQMGQITPSAAFGPPRDTSAADAEKRRDEAWQNYTRLMQAATDAEKVDPALSSLLRSQAMQFQNQALAGLEEKQTGPVLLSEVEAKRTKTSMSDFHKQLKAQGRNPSPKELAELWMQQTTQPQQQR